MYHYLKYLGLALIMLLGLYPIAELTRVIVVSGVFYFPDMTGQLYAEVAVMWVMYLSIIPVFLFFNNRRSQDDRRLRRRALKQNSPEMNMNSLAENRSIRIPVKYIQ